MKKIFAYKLVIVLAFLALIITAYLTYQHFAPAGSKFCNISDSINCDVVNKSTYSELFKAVHLQELEILLKFDIPVAILGLIAYFSIIVLSLFYLYISKINTRKYIQKTLLVISGLGSLFSVYLTFIEAFVLHAWCIFCITQTVLIMIIFLVILSRERA
ncbi:MAG: vitamin K epoxide reductase family protein [Nanoarchaeota archaeon]